MKIEKLSPKYSPLLDRFDCGDDYFNNFFKSKDSLNHSIGTTYIYLTEEEDNIVGYYNLTAGSVDYFNGTLLIKDSGAIHINYLAVAKESQKKLEFMHFMTKSKVYTSDLLLWHCIQTVKRIRKNVLGVSYITLASSEAGLNLYERNGFSKVAENDDIIIPVNKNEYTSIPMYLFLDEA